MPVYKEGDGDNSASYRPVSLIYIVLKTLEMGLHCTVANHLEDSK